MPAPAKPAENPADDTIKILTIDSNVYIGKLTKTADSIVVTDALALGEVGAITKKHLIAYLEAKCLGTLETDIVIGGNGVSYSQRDLPKSLELEFTILNLQLAQAKELAVPRLITEEFKKLAAGA